MNIGIDATAALAFAGGVTKYIRNLLFCISQTDHRNDYAVYYRYFRTKGKQFDLYGDNFTIYQNKIPIQIYKFLKHLLPITVDKILPDKVELIHFPDHVCDVRARYKGKVVVTIHDLFVFLCPQFMKTETVSNFSKGIKNSIVRVDKIITVSESTKKDIMKYFDISSDKIKVIYNGYDKNVFYKISENEDLENIRNTNSIPSKYLLFVGQLSPRKNIEGVVKAFEQVKKKHREYKLVIAGSFGWYYKDFQSCFKNCKYKDDILVYKSPSDQLLALLYNFAEMLLYPSFYEGFGLPIVESMACGTPVITSNISSMPEIGANSAIYVDPLNIEQISLSIGELIDNKDQRELLVNRGLKISKNFSWMKMAQETLKVYSEVLSK